MRCNFAFALVLRLCWFCVCVPTGLYDKLYLGECVQIQIMITVFASLIPRPSLHERVKCSSEEKWGLHSLIQGRPGNEADILPHSRRIITSHL